MVIELFDDSIDFCLIFTFEKFSLDFECNM